MKRNMIILGICAGLLAIALSAMNLLHGNLNQDEGWYLYAARMVRHGATPYADFAYTQAPLLPYVYSLFYPVVERYGVFGGRFVTTGFGVLSALLSAATAARMVDRHKLFTALAVWMLVACNVYQSYFTTVVKTYALCVCLIMAALYALTYRKGYAALIAACFLALAAGTRLSAGVLLPVVGVWLIFQRNRRWHWVWFGVGGGAVLLVVFAPFFSEAYDQAIFGLLGYHAGRDPGGLKSLLVLKMGFVSRFVQAYLVFALLTLGSLCWSRKSDQRNAGVLLLWMCGIGISLVHFTAAFPYDDYQAIAYPVLAAAIVLTLAPRVHERWLLPALSCLLLASIATAFSSPVNQDWFVRGRDRIWWLFKDQSDLEKLRAAANIVRSYSLPGDLLLTQDVYLAVEADRAVPSGMEMGPFCYYPDFPREKAERFHLLNREMMMELLESGQAQLAAYSGYGLAIESPAILPVSHEDETAFFGLIEQRYEPLAVIDAFGQAHTALKIYTRKDVE
ncbi:MAG: glycosyltransferase family 39 protein [Pontiellaceae bacterium]|nr:glycosyltransferase family 39 protein [Pontiellaceae bacterium]MBN2786346.1 glycosyltransferase family 39 protein [Pontiellaceae bacterium]